MSDEKKKPHMHPATWKLFQESAGKFQALRKRHTQASAFMWAGMLASEFTDDEWVLLRKFGFLSEHDETMRSACHVE